VGDPWFWTARQPIEASLRSGSNLHRVASYDYFDQPPPRRISLREMGWQAEARVLADGVVLGRET
jgi:hypothetical protein